MPNDVARAVARVLAIVVEDAWINRGTVFYKEQGIPVTQSISKHLIARYYNGK